MSNPNQYTVGWICAIETEYVAARCFLDKKHPHPESLLPHDNNHYTLGEIAGHNVVIAVLPDGDHGTSSATTVARDMLHSFPNIRFGLIVGIGGGVPTRHDIRLGDVVVSSARNGRGSVVQYDLGKALQGKEFLKTGLLNQPPRILRAAVSGLRAQYEEEGHQLKKSVQAVLDRNKGLRRKYSRPPRETDRLYESHFVHLDPDATCSDLCGRSRLISRSERTEDDDDPTVHYGLIASGNSVIKDAIFRDKLAAEQDVLCFEMEAAGLLNHFPCMVIQGICDYADSHENKEWQGYAAMTAAAYARDLLREITPRRVELERNAVAILKEIGDSLDNVSNNVHNVRAITNESAKKIEDLANVIKIKELPLAEGTGFGTYVNDHEDEFLPGARRGLLQQIEERSGPSEAKRMLTGIDWQTLSITDCDQDSPEAGVDRGELLLQKR
ncbi:nucleoside phosphorylase domain-containing protein [Aspergillus heterothallicus]